MSTRTRIISRALIEEAIDMTGAYQVDIREDYSGRGMYGDECFGLVVESEGDAFKLFAALGQLCGERGEQDEDFDPDLATDLASSARTDSMGRSLIVYFPRWTLEG